MKDIVDENKSYRFAAFPIRQNVVFLWLFLFLPFTVFLLVLSFYIDVSRWYVFGSAVFMLICTFGCVFAFVWMFCQSVTVTEDEIILKGIFGVIRQYEISYLDGVEYYSNVGRRGRTVLILIDRLVEDKTVSSDINGKKGFICVDFTKKNLQNIRRFWHDEIEYLPQKYKSHANE